eukprot:scaffold7066_cov253-Pinguiococcus_pyrenoidosus.AAC.9
MLGLLTCARIAIASLGLPRRTCIPGPRGRGIEPSATHLRHVRELPLHALDREAAAGGHILGLEHLAEGAFALLGHEAILAHGCALAERQRRSSSVVKAERARAPLRARARSRRPCPTPRDACPRGGAGDGRVQRTTAGGRAASAEETSLGCPESAPAFARVESVVAHARAARAVIGRRRKVNGSATHPSGRNSRARAKCNEAWRQSWRSGAKRRTGQHLLNSVLKRPTRSISAPFPFRTLP